MKPGEALTRRRPSGPYKGKVFVGDWDRFDRLLSCEPMSLWLLLWLRALRSGALLIDPLPLIVLARGVWSLSISASSAGRFPKAFPGVEGSITMGSGDDDEQSAPDLGGETGWCRLRGLLYLDDRLRLREPSREFSRGKVLVSKGRVSSQNMTWL